jgi:hypothetical protein
LTAGSQRLAGQHSQVRTAPHSFTRQQYLDRLNLFTPAQLNDIKAPENYDDERKL